MEEKFVIKYYYLSYNENLIFTFENNIVYMLLLLGIKNEKLNVFMSTVPYNELLPNAWNVLNKQCDFLLPFF
jgi:hypothetical protein